jgi:hypothetical protein
MRTISSDAHDSFMRVADQLALMPETIARLIVDHAPDGNGYCRTCTRPGYGTPVIQHPCSVAALAIAALDVRKRTGLTATPHTPSR